MPWVLPSGLPIVSGLACLLAAAVPPLTDAQRTRLATAYDGRDYREEAFVALLESAATFAPDPAVDPDRWPGATPVRLEPDPHLAPRPDATEARAEAPPEAHAAEPSPLPGSCRSRRRHSRSEDLRSSRATMSR